LYLFKHCNEFFENKITKKKKKIIKKRKKINKKIKLFEYLGRLFTTHALLTGEQRRTQGSWQQNVQRCSPVSNRFLW